MKKILTIYLALFSITIGGCQDNKTRKNMKNKFWWNPGIGCAQFYPMEGYRLDFIFTDGTSVGPAFSDFPNGIWGKEDGSSMVGDELKPIPVRLDVTWLSYTENKFYTGSFPLPYDTILYLFQKGIETFMWDGARQEAYSRHDTYKKIIAGLAPGGVVVVWLQGEAYQVEVARFQAKETTVDIKKFIGRQDVDIDQATYVKSTLERDRVVTNNLSTNGIPFGLWDRYRERFNMRPVIKYDQHHAVKTQKIFIDFLNGESDDLFSLRLDTNEFAKRARVKSMAFTWSDSFGGKLQPYYLEIKFKEAELFKAYKEVYGNDPDQQGELVVEVNRGNDEYRVFLQSSKKKIELVEREGEIFYQ